jgi:cytochrome c-type biogenesis protein CcmH
MKTIVRLLVFTWFLIPASQALAVIETYEFSNPELETRYQQLSEELRCPKCQNQTIADSNAPIAQDLRKLLHRQLEQGASDDEILEHMVARYGEFVRYRPRFSGTTAILWIAPLLLLAAGFLVLFLTLRSRPDAVIEKPGALSVEEQARIDVLLAETEKDS